MKESDITTIAQTEKPIYIGEFTDIISKFHDLGVYVGSPTKQNTVEITGYYIEDEAKAFAHMFDVATAFGPIGQSMNGLTIDVGSLTISEYVEMLTHIYHTL
jgi:hypothetical protein